MSQEAILIFVGVVSILFMLVGIYGIQQKMKFSKKVQTMHKLTGVIVDYDVVQSSDEDNGVEDVYFPIYEYEWGGTKKRLESKSSVQAGSRLGKTVHILVVLVKAGILS